MTFMDAMSSTRVWSDQLKWIYILYTYCVQLEQNIWGTNKTARSQDNVPTMFWYWLGAERNPKINDSRIAHDRRCVREYRVVNEGDELMVDRVGQKDKAKWISSWNDRHWILFICGRKKKKLFFIFQSFEFLRSVDTHISTFIAISS